MPVIARRIPQSNITIKKALNKGFSTQSTLPAARRFFQPRLAFSPTKIYDGKMVGDNTNHGCKVLFNTSLNHILGTKCI